MGEFLRDTSFRREPDYESRLVSRFQSGDPEALGALFEIHIEKVYAFARHLLGSREDAEEIASQAFMRAFERAATFRGDCPFRGWLFGITRNLCYDRLRQPKLMLLDDVDLKSDFGHHAEQMTNAAAVRAALSRLTEEHRLVLVMCDVEQWDAREVAPLLDRSVAATKSLLYRARKALRDLLTAAAEQDESASALQ